MAQAPSLVLMIYSGPDYYEPGERALQDAQSFMNDGYIIRQVFFYGPGTLYANEHLEFPSGLLNLQGAWRAFSRNNKVPLVVCSTAGMQYGVRAEPPPIGNLAAGFVAGGLAEFVEQLSNADQLHQY
ncbi:DsrE family protein [Aliidiomarina indica]|uniref:DsrE family protein n=1 Tax=Aliidiomarina indica TaxID=2749147 RepID=UPI00188E27F7|nr:DsrE family protein [Aliidiomarina indica]